MRILRITLLTVLALVLIAGLFIAWAIGTRSGTQWVLQRVDSIAGERLNVRAVSGTLTGALVLQDIRFRDSSGTLIVSAERATLQTALSDLFARRVHLERVTAHGVEVRSRQGETQTAQPREAAVNLDPPVDIVLDQLIVEGAQIWREGEEWLQIKRGVVSGRWTDEGITVKRLMLVAPQGRVDLQGSLDERNAYVGTASGEFRWTVNERTYAGTLEASSTANQITTNIELSDPFAATVLAEARKTPSWPWDLTVQVPQDRRRDITARASGQFLPGAGDEGAVVKVQKLAISQPEGELTARGEIRLSPVAWEIDAQASRFNPRLILEDWPGSLSFELHSTGRIAQDGPLVQLQLTDLDGTLRGRPVSGTADLTLRPDRAIVGSLRVSSGSSTVRLQGKRGEQMQVSAVFDVKSLDDWWPRASGSLEGRLQAQGTWPHISVTGHARGRDISAGPVNVERVSLEADIEDVERREGVVEISGRELVLRQATLQRFAARLSGDQGQHVLSLKSSGDPVGGNLLIRGSLEEEKWTGTLAQLALQVPQVGRLRLQGTAPLSFSNGAISLGEMCLTGDDVRVCVSGEREPNGSLRAHYELANLPVPLLVSLTEMDARIAAEGRIAGRGNVRRTAEGMWYGEASLSSPEGRIRPPGQEQALLTYQNLSAAAQLSGKSARLSVDGQLNKAGQIEGNVLLTQLGSESPGVRGSGRVVIKDLAPLGLFVPRISEVRGSATVRAQVSGTLSEPDPILRAEASGLGAHIPELGIELSKGRLEVSRAANGDIDVAGQIASGGGQLSLRGDDIDPGRLRVKVNGKNFLLADLPGAQIRVAPELSVRTSGSRIAIEGAVRIPQAMINVQRLPEQGAGGISPDVEIIDARGPVQEEEPGPVDRPIYADVKIILGDEVELTGFGLNATLDGQLVVHEEPGERPTGSGDLQLEGTYKAYGQDLTIERGSLLFAGTPLSNPRLDIVAYRDVDDEVRPGLHVTGTANNPQISVTSVPAMAESEALSYLVTGGPLSAVGEGEGDLLTSAAQSVGTAAGNLLAKSIGSRIGIDQIGIDESEALQGESALTIGEYLSPRLFVSYGVGLFTPGDVVTLRYRLTEDVDLQASSTPEETRASIRYEREN